MATAKKFLSSAIEMDGKFEDAKKLLKLIESKV